MIKMVFRLLIVIVLLSSFILGLVVVTHSYAQGDAPLLYLTDYGNADEYYMVVDIETGKTHRFERPEGYVGNVSSGGECCYQDRIDITSPYDESVRFAMAYDYTGQNSENSDQLYRVGEDDQLEPILTGDYIYIREQEFSDNGRYAYMFKKSKSDIYGNFFTLYRYDIETTELRVVAEDVPDAGLKCQENWCQFISGLRNNEDSGQRLFILNKNSTELREIETADTISIHYWLQDKVLFYTAYHVNGRASIHTYTVETEQYRVLSEIEGQGIVNITRGRTESTENSPSIEWMIVVATSLDDIRAADLYIVNDLASNPTTYSLGIQTNNQAWLPYERLSDGSLLLVTQSPQNYRINNLYIINDIAGQPTVDELSSAEFNATSLSDVRLETEIEGKRLIRANVSEDEWRYYSLHTPTRTIRQLASFNNRQHIVETQFSADKKWLALSIEESSKYYLGIISMDGSQPMQIWDVGTESYVCLVGWYAPRVEPHICELYFGIG